MKLWGTDTVLVTDEVYGDALDPVTGQDHGCPWGWARFIDISDETTPRLDAEYRVEQNDARRRVRARATAGGRHRGPRAVRGLNKVVMWSYPVIDDGLIYVVDVRNGLYILRYTGPHADEVGGVDFLEGNSNLGDALRFEPLS